MELATSRNIGPAICELFGINANATTELSVHFEADSIVKVRAEICLTEDQAASMVEILKCYRLEPLPNSPS